MTKICKMNDTVLAGDVFPVAGIVPEWVASLELLTEEFCDGTRTQTCLRESREVDFSEGTASNADQSLEE
ncbi:hypothetical protein [Nitrosospira lacus]|uniref:hypothetical protein n=1 Tax=Nitrosospira lacus TaxID=1288494 RepID=UPI00125EA9DC|nr:hypothetical protein [Nitrosospira lacus]